jgi:hypothetical protein
MEHSLLTVPQFAQHVQDAIDKASKNEHRLDDETLAVKGFSTAHMRKLYNNLCAYPGMTYLEIGLWCGASFTAACCNNKQLTAYGIENFDQSFGLDSVRYELTVNLNNLKAKAGDITTLFTDCWQCGPEQIKQPVDYFFYDGHHDTQWQLKALPHFLPCMSNVFLYGVDDYNWPAVRKGTEEAFSNLADKIVTERSWVWETPGNDDPTFHNGLALFLCRKV